MMEQNKCTGSQFFNFEILKKKTIFLTKSFLQLLPRIITNLHVNFQPNRVGGFRVKRVKKNNLFMFTKRKQTRESSKQNVQAVPGTCPEVSSKFQIHWT